jgi:hypothetical protein
VRSFDRGADIPRSRLTQLIAWNIQKPTKGRSGRSRALLSDERADKSELAKKLPQSTIRDRPKSGQN